MKAHVKKNDLVVVMTGAHRGKKGKVLSVDPGKGRVVVEGVRVIRKAVRKSQDRPQGGFVEREASIHLSNVMPADHWEKRKASAAAGAKE